MPRERQRRRSASLTSDLPPCARADRSRTRAQSAPAHPSNAGGRCRLAPGQAVAIVAVREDDDPFPAAFAADEVEDNFNPVGRLYYSGSTFLCVPHGLSQPGGYTMGAQAGESAIRQVTAEAGFTRFRRAAQTPFNLVYEIRP